MKTIRKISALCVALSMATLFLNSCSKEKTLEKTLEGSWNVSSYEGDGSGDDGTNKTSSTATVSISVSNAGNYTFNDDGTGSYSLTYDMNMTESTSGTETVVHVHKSGSFTWDNDKSSVTIEYQNGGQDVFTVETNEKGKQVWSGTSSHSLNNGVEVNVGVFNDALSLDLDIKMTLVKE